MARENNVGLPGDLDALLEREMAMEPSPAFLPRVRERITIERPASGWSWRVLAAVGVAAVTVLAVSSSLVGDPVTPPVAPRAPLAQMAAPITAVASAPVIEPAPARVPPLVRAADARVTHVDPPVIVDERQRAALSAVIRMVGRGELTDKTFAQTVPPSMQPIEEGVTGIAVAPLAVSPIVVGGVLQPGTEQKQPPRPADAGFRP